MNSQWLRQAAPVKVVPFDLQKRRTAVLDLSASNRDLQHLDLTGTEELSSYIQHIITESQAETAVGGYNEDRTIYRKSELFGHEEPRTVHLGIDIWAPARTPVSAAYDGHIHSFQDNRAFGDYGPTVILSHTSGSIIWHTLYGHLSRKSLEGLKEGDEVGASEVFAEIGDETENGQWPPHLHFQIILDMEGKTGDYPGVCAASQREYYLKNCPDPQLLLQIRSLDQV